MSRSQKMNQTGAFLLLMCLALVVTGCGKKLVNGEASFEPNAASTKEVRTYGNVPSHERIMRDGLADDENFQLGESTIHPNSPTSLGHVSDQERDGTTQDGLTTHGIFGGSGIGTLPSSTHPHPGGQGQNGFVSEEPLDVASVGSDPLGSDQLSNDLHHGDQLHGRANPEDNPGQKGVTFSGNLRDVHFDFDSWRLTDSAQETLAANAEWLKSNPHEHVTIEGHCDERGTQSYNYVLGEKRAAMVQQYLSFLGVPLEQMYIASYGKDRPTCRTMTKDCFDQNRRAHFNSKVNMASQ